MKLAVLSVALAAALPVASAGARWVLPVPDGGTAEPSHPSAQGQVVAVGDHGLTVERDSSRGRSGNLAEIELSAETQFFTA